MSIYLRGNTYWAIFYVGGVRTQRSTGTSNRRLAERIERKYKDEAVAEQHGVVEHRPDITVAELAAQFLADGNPKFHHKDRLKHLLPFFGAVPVRALTRGLVANYRQLRQQHDTIAPATTNRDISVLRRVCNWAVEQNLIANSPLNRIGMERERRTKKPVLSVAEEDALLACAPPHLKDLVIAALDSGMRRGELTSQRCEDLDVARGILFVSRSKTPEGEARELVLTSRLLEIVRTRSSGTGFVFTYKGSPIKFLKRSWESALKRAGLRHIRFHDLRHTHNTRLMEAGVMLEVRMALMGHSGGQSTNLRYTHVELPAKRKAIAALEAWVAEQRRSLAVKSEGKEDSNASTQTTDAQRPTS